MAAAAKASITTKRALKQVFEESHQLERKLTFQGPDQLRPDSRYSIAEIADDFVSFKLLGEDFLVVPYLAITSLRVAATQLTIRYR